MSFREARVRHLERCWRRQHPSKLVHFTSIVHVPSEIPHVRWHAWLAEQPCACRQTQCPERRIGLLVPTRCTTAEGWQARVRRYAERREAPPEFPEADLTVILNKGQGAR